MNQLSYFFFNSSTKFIDSTLLSLWQPFTHCRWRVAKLRPIVVSYGPAIFIFTCCDTGSWFLALVYRATPAETQVHGFWPLFIVPHLLRHGFMVFGPCLSCHTCWDTGSWFLALLALVYRATPAETRVHGFWPLFIVPHLLRHGFMVFGSCLTCNTCCDTGSYFLRSYPRPLTLVASYNQQEYRGPIAFRIPQVFELKTSGREWGECSHSL
jgi:hypothetical protein